MPPRKVQENDDQNAQPSAQGIETFELPKSTLLRLARGAIPENVKVGKEIPLALSKASTVFVGYLAGFAHDIADDRDQKTIGPSHVLEAVKNLEWDDSQELYQFLKAKQTAYRQEQSKKKESRTSKSNATSKTAAAGDQDVEMHDASGIATGDETEEVDDATEEDSAGDIDEHEEDEDEDEEDDDNDQNNDSRMKEDDNESLGSP